MLCQMQPEGKNLMYYVPVCVSCLPLTVVGLAVPPGRGRGQGVHPTLVPQHTTTMQTH